MRALILGCGGMLGNSVRNEFPNAVCTDSYIGDIWLTHLDVRDYDKCEKYIKNTDLVINLAAITDMELCEVDKKLCYDTNYYGARKVAELCTEYDKELVYISTAGIFSSDISKEYFTDTDIPNPRSHYAISKYYGEQASLIHKKSYIIRAGWMFGSGMKDKKFIMKLIEQLRRGVKELYVVNDKKGTPTYTVDFAKGIKNIVNSKKYGVYNQVCEGFTDRLEVAKELIRLLGIDIKINEVSSDYFSKDYYAIRPDNEALKSSEGITMRHWKICLDEYVNDILKYLL